jgi:predicted DNA-binding transcriptional regulator AlpA
MRPDVTGRRSFHLDKRASAIAATDGGEDGDDLLSSQEVSMWLGVSVAWLEIGRSKNYGPSYVRVSSKVIRYKRSDVRAFLNSRVHKSTAEYLTNQDQIRPTGKKVRA